MNKHAACAHTHRTELLLCLWLYSRIYHFQILVYSFIYLFIFINDVKEERRVWRYCSHVTWLPDATTHHWPVDQMGSLSSAARAWCMLFFLQWTDTTTASQITDLNCVQPRMSSVVAVIIAAIGRCYYFWQTWRVSHNARNNAHICVSVPSVVSTNAFLKARCNSGCCLRWCRCLFCALKGPVLYQFSDPYLHSSGEASYDSETKKTK